MMSLGRANYIGGKEPLPPTILCSYLTILGSASSGSSSGLAESSPTVSSDDYLITLGSGFLMSLGRAICIGGRADDYPTTLGSGFLMSLGRAICIGGRADDYLTTLGSGFFWSGGVKAFGGFGASLVYGLTGSDSAASGSGSLSASGTSESGPLFLLPPFLFFLPLEGRFASSARTPAFPYRSSGGSIP